LAFAPSVSAQSALTAAQSALSVFAVCAVRLPEFSRSQHRFPRAFTAQFDQKPVEPDFEPVEPIFCFSGGRLSPLLFLSLSPLPFSVSYSSRRRPLFLLSHLHTPLQKLSCALTLLEELLDIRSSRRSPSSSSISLGFLDPISGSRYCPISFPCTRSYTFLII
jgi:hypothetical protein